MPRVLELGLERVTKAVTEVERAAQIVLVRIGREQLDLLARGATDDVAEHARVAPLADGLDVALENAEQLLVAADGYLDRLGDSGGNVAVLERGQRRRVGEDGARMVEGAHEVLGERGVDGDLAADSGIMLRQ